MVLKADVECYCAGLHVLKVFGNEPGVETEIDAVREFPCERSGENHEIGLQDLPGTFRIEYGGDGDLADVHGLDSDTDHAEAADPGSDVEIGDGHVGEISRVIHAEFHVGQGGHAGRIGVHGFHARDVGDIRIA